MERCIQSGCGRVDGDIGKCGAPITCPKLGVAVKTDGSELLLTCDCGMTPRVIPVVTLVAGRNSGGAGRICQGSTDHCRAKVSVPGQEVFITEDAPAKPVKAKGKAKAPAAEEPEVKLIPEDPPVENLKVDLEDEAPQVAPEEAPQE